MQRTGIRIQTEVCPLKRAWKLALGDACGKLTINLPTYTKAKNLVRSSGTILGLTGIETLRLTLRHENSGLQVQEVGHASRIKRLGVNDFLKKNKSLDLAGMCVYSSYGHLETHNCA